MKHIIIFLAVLAPFVPELGGQAELGRLGGAGTADRVLVPAAVIIFLFARRLPATPVERLSRPLLVFLFLAFVASISVPLRFPAADSRVALMGVFRLMKFVAYAGAGLASLRLFASKEYRTTIVVSWSVGTLLLAGTLINQALLLDAGKSSSRAAAALGNSVSVALACTSVAAIVAITSGWLRKRQAWLLGAVTFAGLLGMLFSQGRGGWISIVIGVAFMTRRIRFRYLIATAAVIAVVVAVASSSSSVQQNLTRLLVSDQGYSVTGDDADTTVDDGGRMANWGHEAAKLSQHPVLGYGIFHRGGASALWTTGSHNFFLQMFLETGLLGGSAFLAFVWSLWRGTGSLSGPIRIGAQAVLITTVAGGMGGEYFYGDAPLYCLFISLWMLAIPEEMQLISRGPPKRGGQPPRSGIQPFRSRSEKTARSGTFSAARASEPPSPRSTTQSAPIT